MPATRVRVLLATLLLAVLPVSAGLTAAASMSATAATTEGETEAAGALALSIAPADSGIVRPEGTVAVRLVATNFSITATPAGTADLRIAAETPADGRTLAAWFGDAETDARPRVVATAALPALDPGSSAVIDLSVPAESAGFAGPWGPRLVDVVAAAESGPLGSARSALVWVPEGANPGRTTTTAAIPLTTPGVETGLLSSDDLEVLTAPSGLLVRALEAVAGRPVAIGIDPRIIASIRILGSSAPESAVAFLDRLALVPNDTFALAWADADPIATVQARGVALPEPEGPGSALDPALLSDDAIAGSPAIGAGATESPEPTTSATPSPSPEAPPALARLAAWPHDLENVVWPREGTVTAESLAVLGEAGAGAVIVGSSNLAADPGLVGRAGGVRVLRSDDALSHAARAAVAATSDHQSQGALARVSALLAASSAADATAVPLMTLSRDRLGNSLRLSELLGAIEALPWAHGGSLAAAAGASGPAIGVIDGPLGEARLLDVSRMLDAEAADRVFARVAVTPSLVTDERRLELLAALSLGWGEQSTTAAEGFLEASSQLRSSVQIVESSTITLLTDRTSLPVTVQNGLDVPIRVFVRVDAATAQLLVEDRRVETLVEPRSQTRALVPVQSLTNGEVDITVSLLDDENRVVGEQTSVLLNLQAGWETAAVVVLAVAIGGLFAFGLARDIRRRRSRRAERAAERSAP